MTRNGRRRGIAGVLLLVAGMLVACGPKVSDVTCTTTKTGDARYTFKIENTYDDREVSFQWIVNDDPTVVIDDFNRHGETIVLQASDTTTRTETVDKDDEDGVHVQLFWPGIKGDDTMKYDEIVKSTCP
jgi:hypothetical protein